MPLSKQLVLLNLYSENLSRWQGAVQDQFNETLRSLIFGLFGLAMLLGAVFAGSHIWGKLPSVTFRIFSGVINCSSFAASRSSRSSSSSSSSTSPMN